MRREPDQHPEIFRLHDSAQCRHLGGRGSRVLLSTRAQRDWAGTWTLGEVSKGRTKEGQRSRALSSNGWAQTLTPTLPGFRDLNLAASPFCHL